MFSLLQAGRFAGAKRSFPSRRWYSTPASADPSKSVSAVEDERVDVLSDPSKTKAILMSRISGTFTSVSKMSAENPSETPLYGSTMPYILHQRWYCHPIIALRNDEPHLENIDGVAKSSLSLFPLTPKHISPSDIPICRVNIVGECKAITGEDDLQVILERYEESHPGSRALLEKEKDVFSYFEFVPESVHFMKSDGEMYNIETQDFLQSPEDPIAPHSRPLLVAANHDHPAEIRQLCKKYGGVVTEESFVYGMDHLGLDIMGKEESSGNWMEFRLPWEKPIRDVGEYAAQIKQTAKELRESMGEE
eukprot:TRINITY_DN10651_c0_g1_i1.p1 TRINITY_DN10651_c0_g1~~TRINITY_DN10651_c0_g1_i1.p1  ORF type:complete len:328 (+),score=86.55 TRINITY_DN10651_c0_g1_i1:68-985(+)